MDKTYQKQKPVFKGKLRILPKKSRSTRSTIPPAGSRSKFRLYKNIGLGFKTPKEAINGTYIDKKCPFTGNVSIRGRILKGRVISTKMNKTIIIRRDYLHYIPKYNRYEKRHKNIPAHCSPCFIVKEGDVVTIGQCRPLSKTIRFNVLKVQSEEQTGTGKRKFTIF
eukprot:TRINITY_DN8_c0_g1_i1.p1 TRINITY_DN8_c0_g1~~TRINITY_DN8_c0_g1_i1.p1  ORF type:complete len:166 (-),score=29.96 TRINITY_DN8_c0_g1_i1:176-673(-)